MLKKWTYFDVWMEDVECEEVVKYTWNNPVFSSTPDEIFRDKLKNVKKYDENMEQRKVWCEKS